MTTHARIFPSHKKSHQELISVTNLLSQVICPADIPLVMQRVRTHSIDVMLSLEKFDILNFKFATQINSW